MDALIPYNVKFDITLILIIAFSGIAISLFVIILFLKIVKASRNIRNTRYINKIENTLNELVAQYGELDDSTIQRAKENLKKLSNTHWKKVLITDLFIHYNTNLTGGVESFIGSLYYELGLEKLNMKELKTGSVKAKVRAMRYLSEMRYEPARKEVMKYINDERKLLRVEASLSLMFLLTKNPLFFLDSLEKRMTMWQKLNVYKRLRELPQESIPRFDRWYESKNKSVVLFAMEMTAKFNQSESKEAVSRLLLIDDVDVQSQAIRTLAELEAFEYADTFTRLLKITSSELLALELLKAIGEISLDEAHLEILQKYLTHPKHSIRFQAAKAMLKIENGRERFHKLVEMHPDHLLTIANHLENPLLN